MSFDHQACELEVFCRNPLHPGPCKGWKKTLGHIAPGALTAIEKAQKEKTAARRAARAAAKSAAEKHVAGKSDLLAHPLTAKKATVEHAETLLGNNPGKAQLKAHKTILNKQEIKKYSQLKAAQIAGIAGDKGLNSDPEKYKKYLEGAISTALAKDSQEGGTKNYNNLLSNLGEALASGMADRYCGVGSKDGDCDGLLYEGLHAHAAQMLTLSLRDGNPDRLNALESDLKGIGDDRPALQAYLKKKGVDLDHIKSTMYEPDVATQEAVDKLKEKLAPPKEPAPSGPKAAFEKGEKTKMDKLGQMMKDQDKANAGADAMSKLAEMTTGKKLTNKGQAMLVSNMAKHQAEGVGKYDEVIDIGVGKISAKNEKITGSPLDDAQQAELAKEIKGAINGTSDGKTPLMDQIQADWANAEAPQAPKPAAVTDPDNPIAKALATGVNADVVKSLSDHPDAWDGLSQTLKDVVGQKIYTENIVGDDITKVITADLIKKHGIPHPVTGNVGGQLPESQTPLAPSLNVAQVLNNPFSTGPEKINALGDLTPDEFDDLVPEVKAKAKVAIAEEAANGNQTAIAQAKNFNVPTPGVSKPLTTPKPAAPSHEMKTAVAMLSDPNASNEDKINALSDLDDSEFKALLPPEKAKAEAAIKEGVAGGDPLANTLAKKHGVATTEQVGPGAKALNPIQQEAVALAQGHKSSTAKQQVAAFENLTPQEFGELSPTTQKLIMAKLAKAKEKFLDPKKKAQTQGIIDKLSPAMGGGSGAGGSGGTVAPSLSATTPLSNEEKGTKAAEFVSDAFMALGKPIDAKGLSATKTVITGLHNNKADGALDQVAESYAEQLLKDANLGLPDAALANFAEPLKADVLEKLKATGAPTPVYDAWKEATLAKGTATAHSALMALDTASLDWHSKHDGAAGGDFLGHLMDSVPTTEDVQKKAESFSEVYDELYKAAAGKAPSTPNQQLTKIHGVLSQDGLTGLTNHHPVAEDLGTNLATAHLAKVIMGLHLPTKDTDDLHNQGVFKPLKNALIQDYAEALSVENSAGGVAAQLDDILKEVNEATSALAKKNLWPEDSVAAKLFKKTFFASKIKDALKGVSPAGTGGSTTAPNPAVAVAANNLPEVDLSGGTNIDHLSDEAKIKILGSFKGLPYAQLKDPPEKIFKNLVAVAAASSKDPTIGPVSLTQVMKAADEKHAQNMGLTNAGLLEKKIKDWLATPAGWDFAQNNAKPDPKLYGTLTGEVHLPGGATLAPGQKVQQVGGPGGFDYGKKSSDFPVVSSAKAIADQEAYWKKIGFDLSEDQKLAISSYTLGSGPMNFYLRGEDAQGKPYTFASDVTKQHIIDLQAAMTPLQYDMSLHRGTGWEFAPKGFRSPTEFKKLIGKTLDDDAFMSSSTGGTAAFGSMPVIIHFEAPAGTMALQVDPWSEFHGAENEMLLAAGTKYKVLEVDTSNPNQTRVKVRIVS
jgi:hypothetical protein